METKHSDLIVLGGGPGGYSAAFRAADLGREVTIIEADSVLGGVCLNRGCIPSKTLLHVVEVLDEAASLKEIGVTFGEPKIDLDQIRSHKETTVNNLVGGLDQLIKARKITRVIGTGQFKDEKTLLVSTSEGEVLYTFNDLILAVGSRPVQIPGIPYDDERIWDSTKALEVAEVPKHLVIIGGGIIGMEMAQIYHGLGSKITIVEMADGIIPPADRDLRQILLKNVKHKYTIHTKTKVSSVQAGKESLTVTLEGAEPSTIEADVVLVAVGRKANSDRIGIENTSITLNSRGWIEINDHMKTNVDHIYAIGDVTGDPMLAHRASYQAKVAAEVASGQKSAFTPMGIPSVAYTSPELAWVGLTENEAKEKGIAYKKGAFPWQASGRALSAMASDGLSKILFDEETGRVLGAAIAGKNAGELIGEAVLALEMGAVALDLSLSIHPHPTLNESLSVAAQMADGIATDLMNR
jgi:dihydrolipoamide dehydrogenase